MKILLSAALVLLPVVCAAEPVLHADGRPIDFFQPTDAAMEALSDVITPDEATNAERVDPYIIVDDIPYTAYWLLEPKGSFAFHPSALAGTFSTLQREDRGAMLGRIFDQTRDVAAQLPNGGITWYYPKNYINNRMVGPTYQYSAVSQARLIAVAMRVAEEDRRYADFADSIRQGMLLDYHDGGLLWEESVFLEFPLHFSPPEIILNGWMDGLLNFGDWPSEDTDAIFQRGVSMMAELLPLFDDEVRKLSLYSTASPVRSYLQKSADAQEFSVEFESRLERFPDYSIELAELPPVVINDKEYRSPYETGIVNDNGSVVTASLSCNQLFDTYVVSDAPFKLNFKVGAYDPTRATPLPTNETVELASVDDEGRHVVHLDAARDRMFCGYPTNFAKSDGNNVYHVYHIVALLYLATDPRTDAKSRATMIEYARKWIGYVDELSSAEKVFAGYQRMLHSINSHKYDVRVSLWSDLLAQAAD